MASTVLEVVRRARIEVEHIRLHDDVHVYRRREKLEISRVEGLGDVATKATLSETQGLVDNENLALLLKGEDQKRIGRNSMVIIPQAWREAYADFGGPEFELVEMNHLVEKGSLPPLPDAERLHDEYVAKKWSAQDLFRVVSSPFPYRTLDGQVMPRAFGADYHKGNMHDGAYDLDKAVECLSGRDDILPFDPNRKRWHQADDHVLRARPLPPFARNEGRAMGLSFYWRPSVDQANQLARQLDEMPGRQVKGEGDVWQLVFEQDLLGLRAAGASLYGAYGETRETVRSLEAEEDDEALGLPGLSSR